MVELLVAIAFVAVSASSIIVITTFNTKLAKVNEEKTRAILYASEYLEAIKQISWDDLSAGNHGLVIDTDHWILQGTSQSLPDGYTRQLTIANVYRESSTNGVVHGKIVSSGGYLDPDSYRVMATVEWDSRSGVHLDQSLETVLQRWQASRWSQTDWTGGPNQATWSDTTKFYSKNAGVDVTVEGIATLISGFLDWANATTTDTLGVSGSSSANYVAQDGDYMYLGTTNNSSGSEFYVINASNENNIYQEGSLDVGGSITGVVYSNGYVYISSSYDSGEFRVIDISNPASPQVAATLNLSGSTDGIDVAVGDSEAFVGQGSNIRSISITDLGSLQLLDTEAITGTIRKLFLSGNYLYVISNSDSQELQIWDVTNPANVSFAGSYNISGTVDPTDIKVVGNRAYIAKGSDSSNRELTILNVADPSNILFLGEYETGLSLDSIAIIGPYAILAQNSSSEELEVIDVSFPATINVAGSFNLAYRLTDMAANCSVIYAGTNNSSYEALTFSNLVEDCGYAASGELESSTYDTGSAEVTYNWLSIDGSTPSDTYLRLQVATSDNSVGPWNYTGPDGSSATYYDQIGTNYISLSANQDNRYIRYKVYLSSDTALQVPVLDGVTISYSNY